MLRPFSNQHKSLKFTLNFFPGYILKGLEKDHRMHAYQNGGGGCLSVMGIANRNRSDLAFVFLLGLLFC